MFAFDRNPSSYCVTKGNLLKLIQIIKNGVSNEIKNFKYFSEETSVMMS